VAENSISSSCFK